MGPEQGGDGRSGRLNFSDQTAVAGKLLDAGENIPEAVHRIAESQVFGPPR